MTSSGITSQIPDLLKKAGLCTKIISYREISSGVTTIRYYFSTDQGAFFIKIANSSLRNHLEAEKLGLEKIIATETLRAPKPLFLTTSGELALLVTEYIHLAPLTTSTQKSFGTLLAKMHQSSTPQQFGFECSNSIGATPQINTWSSSWVDFFKVHRLGYQLKLVEENYRDQEVMEAGALLLQKLPDFFKNMTVYPSLLHGDLWQGNAAVDEKGDPVIFDPSCYYGHNETELSIMQMFGGFSQECFEAYHTAIPKEKGFEERNLCYQLYHYLNHYNIFGKGYRQACLTIFKTLFSQ